MEDIPKDKAKRLLLRNANLGWFFNLYDMYRETTDKPDFGDFMSWLRL